MARNTTLTMSSSWTELTAADVSAITIQNKSGYTLEIAGTTGSAPADASGVIHIPPGGLLLNELMSELWPGVAAVRVFGRGAGQVFVSHA